jgi:signal peptidase I
MSALRFRSPVRFTLIRLFAFAVMLLISVGCSQKKMKQTSSSMEPTIKNGEVISIETKAYSKSSPARWDVVVYENPMSSGTQHLSRVVGLPGETLEIRTGRLVINGKEDLPPSHLSIRSYQIPIPQKSPYAPQSVVFPFTIPAGCYFVMGDHHDSLDSRYWGALDGSKIRGKVPGK